MKDQTVTLKSEVALEPESKKILSEMVALQGVPLWRLQLVRFLMILGAVAGGVGGAGYLDLVKQFLPFLTPEVSAWLLVTGPVLATASRPMIEFIGDWMDDGIKNESFKIPLVLFWLAMASIIAVTASGCAGSGLSFGISADGCAKFEKTSADGRKYKAGPCVGPDGKIDRYVVEWEDVSGVVARTVRYTATGVTEIEYRAADGSWLKYGSKAGFTLGPAPVQDVTPPVEKLEPPVEVEAKVEPLTV